MLRHFLHHGLQFARARLELMELELSQERQRLGAVMLRTLLVACAVLLSAQAAGALVIAAFWDTEWRLHAVAALLMAAAAVSAAAWRFLVRGRRTPAARPITSALQALDDSSHRAPTR